MIQIILTTSLVFFGIAILLTFIRILLGPTFSDRVIAMDVVGVNLISAIAIVSILFETKFFLDVMLVLGILAFISTISYAKFMERGVIIERKRNL
ncbi:MAG TPA: Na(+)/H(+) antiporter subunit F1 [Pseudogracilibacillus sp.]|nr:Na(+)/H(+) antiporter subunit F1 [Pseudogracilibacillus sp.]